MNSATTINLQSLVVSHLHGVGPRLQERLANIHITSVLDLLFHLPLRYLDRTRLTSISALRPGVDVVIEGEVAGNAILFGRKRSLLVKLEDSTGLINLRFFHFSATQKNSLGTGKRIRCFGEVRWGKAGMEMYHPEYMVLNDEPTPLEEFLTPVYPSTEGLHQTRMRSLMTQAFVLLQKSQALPDYLPKQLTTELGFVSLSAALHYIHNPPTQASLAQLEAGQHPAQIRLAFEELLANYLCLRRLRDEAQKLTAPGFTQSKTLVPTLLKQLLFTLTGAQQRVCNEVCEDLGRSLPMLRLIQGDVGSGKTVVAIVAALQAVENSYQVAIMAPTEILAEQHFLNFTQSLLGLDINICFLSGKIKGKKRAQVLHEIESGSAQIIIGTHALFQDQVIFSKLGLLVIDEQHRFGVHQRLALREKGSTNGQFPHQLIMTATPIPRTLTMSAYADLDCSIIDELPPGRTPVNTVLISDQRRQQIIDRIHKACSEGRQTYWVCTLIEESDVLQCQAAENTHAELTNLFVNLKVGLIHGRMKPSEKSATMQAFKAGEIDLLVATTVIEVGVDVPNASLMVIENPERLGLAQLHQLRGRVGRGRQESHCILLYHAPLSEVGKQRLEIMRRSNDGFYIAEQDLKIRGPGEVLGTRQTGLMEYKIADLSRDSHLQDKIKVWAEKIRAEHPELIEKLIKRWLADSQHYGNV
jgi:ATP-dependent DNA helicase RecG